MSKREHTGAYIASAIDALERAGCARPVGWHGPEYGQSERTPALLAELDLRLQPSQGLLDAMNAVDTQGDAA